MGKSNQQPKKHKPISWTRRIIAGTFSLGSIIMIFAGIDVPEWYVAALGMVIAFYFSKDGA